MVSAIMRLAKTIIRVLTSNNCLGSEMNTSHYALYLPIMNSHRQLHYESIRLFCSTDIVMTRQKNHYFNDSYFIEITVFSLICKNHTLLNPVTKVQDPIQAVHNWRGDTHDNQL